MTCRILFNHPKISNGSETQTRTDRTPVPHRVENGFPHLSKTTQQEVKSIPIQSESPPLSIACVLSYHCNHPNRRRITDSQVAFLVQNP